MIEEYDRTMGSSKPSRLRLFLFTAKPEATQSMGQIIESSAKSDDWFLDALNRGFSDSDSDVVNRLLGLDDTLALGAKDDNSKQQIQQPPPPQQQQVGQDVHNLPDSPMLDTSSSFGSTSSSPSLANLPPIRVHVEETSGVKGMNDQRLGIEEQLARFNVGSKIQDDGFAAISSPPPMPVTISLLAAPVNATDDERSDNGVPAGYKKPPTPRSQQQNLPTHQVKTNSGGHEMPSPDSFSSDSSMNNPVFHQSPVYQEPLSQMINPSHPNHNHNQNQDTGYILHPQQSQPQQQQFIHAAAPQYLHHHPSTGHPVQSYIQVYPSQQPYPFYYATAPVPPKPYNTPVTQSVSVTDSLPMMAPPPNSHLRNTPGGKPEAGVYATTTPQGMMGGAQIIQQIPISQQQFMGYSQIHHPPQSVSAGIPNYGYEYAENAPKQVYYTQHMDHAQYQTMTGPPPPAMVLPDGSAAAKLPAENMTQQIRSSQPL
ncbi:Octicosapeptide/Phox/Bem1p family protein [Raphanus sativus]|nr:Octicosapeptide/Phox/Bem1p family protein [Raphanus sativus]